MTRWFRCDTESINDWAVQSLPGDEFKRKFLAAVHGEENEFSRFIKPVHGRLTGPAWLQARARVFERDGHTCRYCGASGEPLECDHVLPVSRGGSNRDDNLVAACFTCNRSKHNKTTEEWLQ